MKDLTLKNILAACGGVWQGNDADLETEISAVTTDSRAVTAGCMFAAIPGERADGHSFIASALKNGALCALAERAAEDADGNLIIVPDFVAALPRNATGKVLRRTLREPYWAGRERQVN